MPSTLVRKKGVASSIERSTWLSAAKWTTASNPSARSSIDQPAVGDVAADEPVPRLVLQPFEVVGVAGVGQGVEVRELDVRIHLQLQTDEVRADEATAAGDKDSFHDPEPLPALTYPLSGFRTSRGCLEETREGATCLARRRLLHVH